MQTERKIKVALEFLKEGRSTNVGDLSLGINASGNVQIIGWSQYLNFSNLTKERALDELEGIKKSFFLMLRASDELRQFVQGKSLAFNLYFDEYGKASISICEEKNGVVKWNASLR
jgi:hypothetical protein